MTEILEHKLMLMVLRQSRTEIITEPVT